MFQDLGFTPIGGQTRRSAPTLYSYKNDKDSLEDIIKPGYFNSKAIMLHPGDIIKIISADGLAEGFIKSIEGAKVVMDSRVIVARELSTAKVKTPKAEDPPKPETDNLEAPKTPKKAGRPRGRKAKAA
uniref:Uncharacterized protein n=1 Tax=uncultured marine virus TaxID=186617 RepID=A0A0F7L706_9VIRU|nr:hypothetical protein [uncultured marine virus]